MARRMKLDFTEVEAFVKCEEGEHIVKLIEIEESESQAGNDMLSATFQVVKGNSTGAKLYDNFVLTEKALWKLQSFLTAVGIKADSKVIIDLDKLVGKTCIVSVEHEEYEGKTRARIQEFKKIESKKYEHDDDDEDDDDEEEYEPEEKKTKSKPQSKPAKQSKPKKQEDDDDFDDDDWDEDDE